VVVLLLTAARGRANPAAIPIPRLDAGWLMDHQAAVLAMALQKPNILFLGDSITWGWDKAGNPIYRALYRPLGAVNAGIPGDQTQNVLWRVQNGLFRFHQPKVVVLMIGVNNLFRNRPDQVVQGIQQIVLSIRLFSPRSRILLMGILPFGNLLPVRRAAALVNLSLALMDDGGRTIRFVNTAPLYLLPNRLVNRVLLSDGVHPSFWGYAVWANAMNPSLVDLLRRP
jgi:lysophospholipase L1-like esterase